MDFRILGPLEAADDAGPAQLAGGKQKALLALLLLHPHRVLPMTQLVDDLWGEEAPESAQKMVQILVSQLRKQFPEGLLLTQVPGYRLDLTGHSLDLETFGELAERGRAALAAGDPGAAAGLFAEALALWRGPALGEFTEPFAQSEADRLEEQHLACREDRIDADLGLGRHAELVGELHALVGRHPHRERMRSQLLLALYRSGRHGEALEAYQAFRRLLRDDLGIEPSSRLRELERQMLQQDPGLDPAPAAVAPVLETPAAAGIDAPDEMLKLVTVLFADLSTKGTGGMHPEDVRALVDGCFQVLGDEVRKEGVEAERLAGNALMATFGVPAAREDDAVHAVGAARRLLERLTRWNDESSHTFELKIGINTGEVIVSPDGEIAGEAVGVAARLQQAANPGTILAGERTARAARSHFTFVEVDQAWEVAGERETAEPRGHPGLNAELVGRASELESLRAMFDRVRQESAPTLVTLIGDAGIGKSRLAGEFCAPLQDDAIVLAGRCLPSGEGVALRPLAEMLKAQAGIFESDGSAAVSAKVGQFVREVVDVDLAPNRARLQDALEWALGPQQPNDSLEALEPAARRREVLAAWRALFASLARRRPVVAVVEDLHWADPALLELLDELADAPLGPVLVLCTARPDLLRAHPNWGGGQRAFAWLPLDPLSVDESRELIERLLDVESLTGEARRRILTRSEGNPFFLEEILRHLIDEGLVRHERGRWRAQVPIDEVELPDSVQAVILARLDLLTPAERRVAQRAAVIGRRFWDGALAEVAEDGDLDTVLRTLRRREFVVERVSSAVAGEREFVFKHVLIRDVAYESLPRRERGRAHLETAKWIEHAIVDRTEMLAHHYDAAYSYLPSDELRARARDALLAASEDAHRRFAIDEGERLARRAVELSESGGERLEALELLADLHYFSGDAAWRAYTDALAEISEDDPAYARLAGKAAEFACRWIGTMVDLPPIDRVHSVIDAGLRVAAPGSAEHTLLLLDRAYMLIQREGRRDEVTRAMIDEVLVEAERLDHPNLLSAALDLASAEHMHMGHYGAMRETSMRRVGLIPRMSDPREIGDAHAMVAWSSQHIGNYREAEEQGGACAERAGTADAGSYLHGLTWRVAARFALGDWDGLLDDHAEIERVVQNDGRDLPPSFTMHGYVQAALCLDRRGEMARADELLGLALRFFEHRPASGVTPTLAAPSAALLLSRRGRFDEAEAILTRRPETGAAGATYAALCEIVAERGAWDEVELLVREARTEAAVGALIALPFHVDRLEGRAAAEAGDPVRAAGLLRRSAEGFAALEAPWEHGWSCLLLGEVLGADGVDELAAARAIFERLGAVGDLERARDALAAV